MTTTSWCFTYAQVRSGLLLNWSRRYCHTYLCVFPLSLVSKRSVPHICQRLNLSSPRSRILSDFPDCNTLQCPALTYTLSSPKMKLLLNENRSNLDTGILIEIPPPLPWKGASSENVKSSWEKLKSRNRELMCPPTPNVSNGANVREITIALKRELRPPKSYPSHGVCYINLSYFTKSWNKSVCPILKKITILSVPKVEFF